jgi:hypothetical protein
MNKVFSEVLEGQRFTLDNKEYIKIPSVKISCCKSINAQATGNAADKIFVQPQAVVIINA